MNYKDYTYIPELPGIYVIINHNKQTGKRVYVGQSKCLRDRFKKHNSIPVYQWGEVTPELIKTFDNVRHVVDTVTNTTYNRIKRCCDRNVDKEEPCRFATSANYIWRYI